MANPPTHSPVRNDVCHEDTALPFGEQPIGAGDATLVRVDGALGATPRSEALALALVLLV